MRHNPGLQQKEVRMSAKADLLDLSGWSPSIRSYMDWILVDSGAEAKEWEHRINSLEPKKAEGAAAEAVA